LRGHYCFVHTEPPFALTYVPIPPLASKYLSRKLPEPVNAFVSNQFEEIVPKNFTLVRLAQSPKALLPMLVTAAGMVTLSRLVQPEKASLAMLVTPFGMFMLGRLVQPIKRQSSMLVILFGKVMLVQLPKAILSILETLSGTALQLSQAYSYVCFITHKFILHKELSQYMERKARKRIRRDKSLSRTVSKDRQREAEKSRSGKTGYVSL